MKTKVFVTRIIPTQGLNLPGESYDVEVWQDEMPPPRAVMLEKVREIDGLLCLVTDKIDAELLDEAPRLKVISNYAVGVDNIDLSECTKRRIPVGNTPDVLTDTTADLAFALLMAAARRVVEGHEQVKAGKWKTWGPMVLLGQDVHASTLGLIGFGRIGQAMARRAQGFDMRVLFCKKTPSLTGIEKYKAKYSDFVSLLRESDFVSLHLPFTPETYHLISDREFDMMKPTAILINTARGQIVDPKALYRALKEGKIAYAALDVTEPEPIPTDDPLLSLPNCIIAPHIGSASVRTRTKMAQMATENLLAGLRGERLPNCVNSEVYDLA